MSGQLFGLKNRTSLVHFRMKLAIFRIFSDKASGVHNFECEFKETRDQKNSLWRFSFPHFVSTIPISFTIFCIPFLASFMKSATLFFMWAPIFKNEAIFLNIWLIWKWSALVQYALTYWNIWIGIRRWNIIYRTKPAGRIRFFCWISLSDSNRTFYFYVDRPSIRK